MRTISLLLLLFPGLLSPVTAKQPNIVLFLADDLGWTGLSSFGSDFYETPNLDRLASQGVKFTNAYSACTVCSPTRASLMTGMYPARLR
jgi:arylsulfatase A